MGGIANAAAHMLTLVPVVRVVKLLIPVARLDYGKL